MPIEQIQDTGELIVYKCPSCAGKLSFDPVEGTYACESCGQHFDSNDLVPKADMALHGFTCAECGAELVVASEFASFPCPYCDNNTIVPSRFKGDFEPEFIIPFSIDRESARERFESFIKSKWFFPDDFLKRANFAVPEGAYVPFWLFNSTICFDYTFFSTEETSDSAKHYLHRKKGSIDLIRMPADASARMPNDLMDSLQPFDFKKMQPFTIDCMPGFIAERYTEAPDATWKRLKPLVLDEVAKTVSPHYNDSVVYEEVAVEGLYERLEQVLVPVWLFDLQFEGKRYLAGINGQTGEIAAKLPVDEGKRAAHMKATGLMAGVAGLIFGIIMGMVITFSSMDSGPDTFSPNPIAVGAFVGIAFGGIAAFFAHHASGSRIAIDMSNVHNAQSAEPYIDEDSLSLTKNYRRRTHLTSSHRQLTDMDENDLGTEILAITDSDEPRS